MSKKHRRPMQGKPDDAYRQAVSLHRAGRLAEAEQLYRSLPPNNPTVLQLQGVLCYQTGRHEEGVALLRKALDIDPEHAEALSNLAVILHERNDFPGALTVLDRALKATPGNPELLNKRGFVLQDLDRHDESTVAFRLAVEEMPSFAEAWLNLGNSLQALERFEEAEEAFRKALALGHADVDAMTNLGSVLVKENRHEEAIRILQRAIDVRPTANAYHNLATALAATGKRNEAISAAQTAAQLEPKSSSHHRQLALLCHAAQRLQQASAAYRKALELEPNDSVLLTSLASTLYHQGRFEETLQTFADAKSLSDGARIAAAIKVPVIPCSVEEIEASRRRVLDELGRLAQEDLHVENPMREIGSTNFFWAYHSESELPMQRAVVDVYLKASPQLAWSAPHCAEPKRSGKIRLGVCSGHLNRHTIGKLYIQLVSQLRDDDIEVVHLDASNHPDDWTKNLNDHVDRAYKLSSEYGPSRDLIAGLELDALFYPDIGMLPLTYYLAFARLAPLQFTTWGHPASTAIPNLDCFLSSVDLEREGAEEDYSERLVKFQELMTVFARPEPNTLSRADLGLPEDRRLYACPQASFKLHPDLDEAFGEILRRDEQGQILLIKGTDPHWDELLKRRFAKTMPDVAHRIVFLEKLSLEEFVGVNRVADAVLDTFYFGGGNSSLEIFSSGAPIVTLPGKMLRGRITLAQYKKMGIDDLIARDVGHYVELALRLANNRDWHREMSKAIDERSPVLYDNLKPIEELRGFIRRECRG